jgi:hypothetical protein
VLRGVEVPAHGAVDPIEGARRGPQAAEGVVGLRDADAAGCSNQTGATVDSQYRGRWTYKGGQVNPSSLRKRYRVTRDRDLLTVGTFRDIPILAAREALDLIAAAARGAALGAI